MKRYNHEYRALQCIKRRALPGMLQSASPAAKALRSKHLGDIKIPRAKDCRAYGRQRVWALASTASFPPGQAPHLLWASSQLSLHCQRAVQFGWAEPLAAALPPLSPCSSEGPAELAPLPACWARQLACCLMCQLARHLACLPGWLAGRRRARQLAQRSRQSAQ